MGDEFEIPVLVKPKPEVEGNLLGVPRYAAVIGRLKNYILNPWVLATIAVVKSAMAAIGAWRRQEEAVGILNQVMVNQGIYTRGLSGAYQEMATAIQKDTLYGDEEVIEAQAALQPMLGDLRISERLMRAVVDFAAKNKMDLVSAAEMVGKSIGTSTNALKRHGIEIDATATKKQRLAQVMAGLEAGSKGQAAAAAAGTGSIRQMQNALNRVLEMVGRALTPFVVLTAKAITSMAQKANASGTIAQAVGAALDGMSLATLILKSTVETITATLPGLIASQLQAAGEAVRGNFAKANERLVKGNRELFAEITKSRSEFTRTRLAQLNSRAQVTQARRDALVKESVELTGKRGTDRKSGREEIDKFLNTRSEKDALEDITRARLKENKQFLELSRMASVEKDGTKRLALEAQRKKVFEEQHANTQAEHEKKKFFFAEILDKEKLNQEKNALQSLSELKNSKFGPQVLIGKAASIVLIGVNQAQAIAFAWTNLSSTIPPPFGQIIAGAVSAFLAWFGAEQIANIASSDIDHPGKIGFGDLTFEDFMQMAFGRLDADIVRGLTKTVALMLEFSADIEKKIADGIHGWLTENLGFVGDAIGTGLSFVAEIDKFVINAVADIIEGIGSIIGDIAEAIGTAIVDVLGEIGNAIGGFFDWLFAEGGVVTTAGGQPVVTPLKQAGLNLRTDVSVKILGGLVPSQNEAKRIARLIAKEMGGPRVSK